MRRVVAAAALALVWASPAFAAEDARPHLLVVLADDLGWKDVGYHGSEIRTPRIDRLAAEGIELDRFYVQPSCSPTRTALMTGKSPLRLGIHRPVSKNEIGGLPLDEKLLPERLAELGYQPLMTGKWHLGHYRPEQWPQARGFEHFYGHLTGGVGYWDHNHGGGHDWQRNGVTVREEGYSTHLVADEAIRLVEGRDRERPLFLYVAFNAPHIPNEAPEETLAKYASIADPNRRGHAGMVDELDTAIGRVLDAFAAEGLLENTIVFFSSDNGGLIPPPPEDPQRRALELLIDWFGRPLPFGGLEFAAANTFDGASDNAPLPGGKMHVSEGGSRVPAAIWWPGHLEGGKHERFMTMSDLMPTLFEAIGAIDAIPSDLDGRSQWAALRGEPGSETPDYMTSGFFGTTAIYRPPWKLADPQGDAPALYDVFADPRETRNLAAERPELVAELRAVAAAWPVPEEVVLEKTTLQVLWDPDFFGGPEDRPPWADVAQERAQSGP